MAEYYRHTRKIDPLQGTLPGNQTPNNCDRIEIGPTLLAFREWEEAGLTLPNLPQMREFRWQCLTKHTVERDYTGLLCADGHIG